MNVLFCPTADQRQQMLGHIAYERDMMVDALGELLATDWPLGFQRSALTECCFLHARNLRFFFKKSTPDRTCKRTAWDTWAGDYYSEQKWAATRKLVAEANGGFFRCLDYRAGKFLAHLSYKRLEESKDTDDEFLKSIVSDIWKLLTAFRLDADKVSD